MTINNRKKGLLFGIGQNWHSCHHTATLLRQKISPLVLLALSSNSLFTATKNYTLNKEFDIMRIVQQQGAQQQFTQVLNDVVGLGAWGVGCGWGWDVSRKTRERRTPPPLR